MLTKVFRLPLVGACCLALLVAGCSDPETRKARYLEKGDALMAAGKLPEAVIEYRNALKIDQRFGQARLQLAKAYEQSGNPQAPREYLRAAELLTDRADVQLKAASILISARQFEQARKHVDAAIKADPKSIEGQILRAYTYAGLKDMDAAIREVEKAIENAPGDYRPYAGLGAIETAGGDLVQAEAAFKKAVELDPSSSAPKLALSYFYWATKNPAEAEKTLQTVVAAEPDNESANRMLAILYLGTPRFKEAEAPLLKLAAKKDSRAILSLGDLYLNTGRADQARPLYESLKSQRSLREAVVSRIGVMDYRAGRKAEAHAAVDAQLKESAKSVSLLTLKSLWYGAEGKRDDAIQMAKTAVAVDAQSTDAHFALGLAEAANRNPDGAMAAFKEALKLNPNMTAAQLELSKLLLARGEADQALQHARAAQKAVPGNPQIRFSVARALLRKGNVREAEVEVQALVKQFPNVAAVHTLQGQVLLARSDGAGALREFDRALEINPAEVEALMGRVVADLSFKRPQDARVRVERAVNKEPRNSSLLIAAARFESAAGNAGGSEQYLRRAIESDPANLEAYNLLASVYVRQKRLDEGKRELEEVVRRKPDAYAARTMIGMIQQLQGKPDDAMKTYDAIVKETTTAAVAANNLAYLYADRGQQLDLAVQLAQSAVQQLPEHPDVSDTLGWAYYKKGMAELAIRPLEFSVQKDPQNPLYLLHLGLAYAKAGRTDKAKTTLTQALKLKADVEGASEARAVLASLS